MSKLIKAVIIDDEKKGALTLSKLLELHCQQVELCGIINESEKAIEFLKEKKPHLIFLDIAMPGLSGFDLLRFFPDPGFKIIFVTAHSEHAIKGYKHSAVDYLLRPVDVDELKDAVDKTVKVLAQEHSSINKVPATKADFIEIQSGDGIVYIKNNQLVRLEADGAYTTFYLSDKTKYIVSYNIKKYQDILDPLLFMRVHKSHIINLDKVKKFLRHEGYYVIMDDGSKVEVSRRLKDVFINRMKESF